MAITEVQEPTLRAPQSTQGVYNIEIDVKQHRVVVTGNVEADALLKKLLKSGKHAELLLPPEKPPQKEKKPDESPANKKDKPISQSHDVNNTQETPHAEEGVKPPPATIKPGKSPQVEASDTGPSGGGDGGKVADAAGQSTSGGEVVVEESKADHKKPETFVAQYLYGD